MIEFESDNQNTLEKNTMTCMQSIESAKLSAKIFIAVTEEETEKFWAVRKAAVPILYLLKGEKKIIPLVEDAAIPSSKLVAYFDGLYKIFQRHNLKFVLYGHIAKGLLHSRPLINMKDPHDIALLRPIADDVFELVMRLGGTISGEHGDGRLRSAYIPRQYHDIYSLFQYVKQMLDPQGTFNPDIITNSDPSMLTDNLRYGENYSAAEFPNKELIWEEGISYEIEKCHGCSKCTTVTTAIRMCPVYKATRDETAAPKAKANLLRALISGAVKSEGLYSAAFQYVIDRCINCTSCSLECPSQVNIPKLALEVKSKYVAMFGIPFEGKLVTNFELFGRYMRRFFPIITPVMKIKALRKIMEIITGLAAERDFIKFNFNSLFDRLPNVIGNGDKKVLYFAGCYATYVRPDIGESVARVLNKLGYTVLLPPQHCCGVPHAAKGFAKGIKKKIEDNLAAWGNLLEGADIIAVSCSSCGLALKKEWSFYMGGELIENIKTKLMHISDIVAEHGLKLTSLGQMRVAYHTSCHMNQMKDPLSSYRLISSIEGIEVNKLPNSCCGIAGSWGMSKKHYNESLRISSALFDALQAYKCDMTLTDCPTCELQLNHLKAPSVRHPIEIIDVLLN
jgi:Fe-S oxidoreductase